MNKYLGEFEQAVLLAVMRLGEDAYGLAIRKELEEQTGRTVTHGAAYITLDRLEAKELLSSRMADPDPDPSHCHSPDPPGFGRILFRRQSKLEGCPHCRTGHGVKRAHLQPIY